MAQSRNGKHSGRLAASTVAACSELDRLWAQVDEIRSKTDKAAKVRPPGSFSTSEFAARYGMTHGQAAKRIGKMLESGALNEQVCYGPAKGGRITPQKYFTIKGKR